MSNGEHRSGVHTVSAFRAHCSCGWRSDVYSSTYGAERARRRHTEAVVRGHSLVVHRPVEHA